MANENVTPEDKLLKIIEDPSSAGKEKRFSALTEKLNYARDIKKRIVSFWEGGCFLNFFTLRTLNKFLIGVCAAAFVFLIFYFNYRKGKLADRLLDIEIGKNGFNLSVPEDRALAVSLDDMLSRAKQRNIFSFVPPPDEEEEVKEEDEQKTTETLADIKVVGIIWSETKPEVMLESVKEVKTFLLREGENMGEVKVKKIYKTKVVVELAGKEWDLR